ncbi:MULTISPECIES: M23 family metallopeptidase [unclassified Salinibacterium]|uniref:M23 family metallopeptidase n=1 Tax=unclassified Salinibacterium TaxID=2632331 RepID=UPI0018CF7B6B|nr:MULTISPECIES: M23 family metallopeptidase [unclassified Salinibacterium]MBH0053135.1 M23 family metallopeptidase [Salinibacterium sp. SWN139]MBH0082401.1 M23 family metallopeptidase [Salinibacterium sp. SWN167]
MKVMHASRGTTATRAFRSIAFRVVGFTAALSLVVGVSVVAGTSQAAFADDYPTWSDVTEARDDEAATKKVVERIEAALVQLEADAAAAQKDAEEKGNIWQEADTKYQAKAAQTATLQEQADAASAEADEAETRIGELASRLVRAGGGDVTTSLLANSQDADALLYNLGMSSKISQQTSALFERAVQARNTAQSLTDAAEVARAELEILKIAAEEAFAEAQAAAQAAEEALAEQQERKIEFDAQLAALTSARKSTEDSYLEGVREREAARAAAAAAAQVPNLDAGEISLSGWARPAGGYITSVYGYSSNYGSKFHKGTDIGAACGAGIYAASSGTVVYAGYGWNGGYGNYIIIEHAGGVRTAYGHIVDGGIQVSSGQSVAVGTKIASVGSTGNSTGCHLHFEVRPNGWDTTNPVPFMAGQGIQLG